MSEVIATGHWEVARAKNAGQKPNPHGGQFDKWYIGLTNLDGGSDCDDAYWQRKAPSEVTVGDKVYGKLEKGEYGYRFYVEKEPDGGGGSSPSRGGSSGAREWKPESQYDPEKTARITRSHSQKMAIRWAALQPDKESLTLPKIFQFADAFERDVQEAGQAANQGAGVAGSPPPEVEGSQGASPATTPAPGSQSAVRDVEMALCEAPAGEFLSGQARTIVANYMLSELPPEELKRATNQLINKADQSQQDQTLRAMKLRAERWTGKPLPESSVSAPGEPEIPFARPEYREPFSERERWRF